MATAAFNPDDFILQDIPSPEDRRTLMEYDAAHRMILLRTKTITNNQEDIGFKAIYITNKVNTNFLSNLPETMHNDRDRIVIFGIYEDGTYDLVKEKMKFDFNSQTTRWVKYETKDWTIEQAKEFFEALKAMLFVEQVLQTQQRDQDILAIINKQEFFDLRYADHCVQRDNLLRECDYRVLPDYPETFEGEVALWNQYREKLRTWVKAPSDFEDPLDYINYCETITWPIDPLIYHEKYPNLTEVYLQTEDQFAQRYEQISTEAQKKISAVIAQVAAEVKQRNEDGISVEKQVYDIIEKYKLVEDVLDFDITKLAVGE